MPRWRTSEVVPQILFNTTPPDYTYRQGRLFFDVVNRTLAVMLENGSEPVTLQIGQEQHVFVRNNTGSDVPNASAATPNGSLGNKITFTLAQANSIVSSFIGGVTTQEILNNAEGFATVFGVINDIDTQTPGWNEGDILYLSETVAGALQNTPPASGFCVAAGIVLRRHLSQGQIIIKPWPRPAFGNILNGHYTQFNYRGTMRAIGNATCYRDELQSLIGSRLESPASDIVQNNPEGSVTFQTSARFPTDYLITNHQLNHDRIPGTDVYPHLHWWQISANIPNWLIEYRWQKMTQGQTKTTAWTPLAWVSNAFTYSAGTINQITGFGGITPPAGYGEVSDIIQFRISRDVTNVSTLFAGADPEASDIDAVNFDSHIQVDQLGSEDQYIKY